ncbi:helix-turn-helix transcriptional regulator [Ornithinimicrobium cryptoxanthini]|uniref:helix-turn-helix transcriptional regulator n=1 Tax=Ornithinimicrobium cryptoxanthini TaxID=2934161 RepID=UPI0021188725|nr:helix-turn-helix transcriptional regulator [Ornithinimicrobium cryptoxanthini]
MTAASHAPEGLEERVGAIVNLLLPALDCSVGLLVRADAPRLVIQVIGGTTAVNAGMSKQIRSQLSRPLLRPVVTGNLAPTSAARAYGEAEWQQSAIRAEALQTLGVDQFAHLPIYGGPGLVTFVFGRSGEDFTDQNLALLASVQPVVAGLGKLLQLSRPTPSAVLGIIAIEADSSDEGGDLLKLTDREIEVLQLLAHGHTAAVIARVADCSLRTVHRHLGNIYDKLAVGDRLSAVNRAQALGLLAPETVDA